MSRRPKPTGTAHERFQREASAKEAQRYDERPPNCANCCRVKLNDPKVPLDRPRCTKGRFVVRLGGICDFWRGHDGSVLD